MALFLTGLALMCSAPLAAGLWLLERYFHVRRNYLHFLARIFTEKPPFIIPRGDPLPGAERASFRTSDGLTLSGCYLKTTRPRRGVILFGLEFGSDCWSCRPYAEHLVESGFDVFAFEARNQGSSDRQPGYEPLQWVTDYELRDTQAALAYLKSRPDADPRGVGLFGISKGGGAGLLAASRDPYVRCCVTDGAFATLGTVIPYVRHFFRIYKRTPLVELIPSWYITIFARQALRQTERDRHCHFPSLERAMRRLRQPLLMIHGEGDTYIKPLMARDLFERARGPKELWLVEGAKHNQALHQAGEEYRRRVLLFFEEHLAGPAAPLTFRPGLTRAGA